MKSVGAKACGGGAWVDRAQSGIGAELARGPFTNADDELEEDEVFDDEEDEDFDDDDLEEEEFDDEFDEEDDEDFDEDLDEDVDEERA